MIAILMNSSCDYATSFETRSVFSFTVKNILKPVSIRFCLRSREFIYVNEVKISFILILHFSKC